MLTPKIRDSLIGGVADGLAVTVLIVIAVVVIAAVVCHCRSNSGNTSDIPADYDMSRLEVNRAYDEVKSLDMTSNSAYGV